MSNQGGKIMRRIHVKKIREIIRIRLENPRFSNRQIARVLNINHQVVGKYQLRFQESGLTLEELLKLKDEELLLSIKGNTKKSNSRYQQIEEKFPYYYQELKRRYVTLKILWEEYSLEVEDPYSYSQFAYHYQTWKETLPVSMHMEHKAGDKLFIDFTGKKLFITDPTTGKKTKVETYIGILGASHLTYFEAIKSQRKEDFIQGTVNCLKYMGGVPKAIIPDCLKSAVTKSDRYEPVINPHFLEMAKYYQTTILPARPLKPKDKSLVEGAVNIVYQRVYATLRDKVFYSLEELNAELRKQMEKYNNKKMQKTNVSRREMYEKIEKESLKLLPVEDYEVKKFNRCRVPNNYHVYLSEDKHYYSVPYRYIKKDVEIHYTSKKVEIYHNHERIAYYTREHTANEYTTLKEHMPKAHQFIKNLDREYCIEEGKKLGESAAELCEKIMDKATHPEQGYKRCMGIVKLANQYGSERLNDACQMSIASNVQSYQRVKMILDKELDISAKKENQEEKQKLPSHHNIRGNEYYQKEMKI